MEHRNFTEEQFVEALGNNCWDFIDGNKMVLSIKDNEVIRLEDVRGNLDTYLQACVQLFRKPAHIREKVETFSGYYHKWDPCYAPHELKSQTIQAMSNNKESIVQGLENMGIEGLPQHYRTGGLDHEIENMSFLIGESGLRSDREVIRTLWNKVKKTPNGYLNVDESKLFLQYTMGTDDGYVTLGNLPEVRLRLTEGKNIPEAVYPLVTDFERCQYWHEKFYEENEKLNSELFRITRNVYTSEIVMRIIDAALKA